jgi:AraC-like DNA-binding protein
MRLQADGVDVDLTRLRSVIGQLARSGAPSLARAASQLGTSPRSLQRHLAGRRLTYSELVESVRNEAAQAMLKTTALPVQEIAIRLGYRTPGSFARAFVRWTGTTPRAYRKAGDPPTNG